MHKLPYEIQNLILGWLPASHETVTYRCVSKKWDSILKRKIVICCVHQYVSRKMQCTKVFGFANDCVQRCVEDVFDGGGSLFYFPHCFPVIYPPEGAFTSLQNPAVSEIAEYSPIPLEPSTLIKDLSVHRLLLSDKAHSDSSFDSTQESFSSYMRLLLRFQVKHQEYAFEHRARMRLLRTYIHNLEHRISCKLRLLLEHISYSCIKQLVLLLPVLEAAVQSGEEIRGAAAKIQLAKYRLVQEEVSVMRHIVASSHVPVIDFAMPELEKYAQFLCSSDDVLEGYVSQCRTEHPTSPKPSLAIETMLQAVITVSNTQRSFTSAANSESSDCSSPFAAVESIKAPDDDQPVLVSVATQSSE
eukprot:TRINITY_DN6445_c1_g1_i1.p1 TRINITY_DN6445_c1_g1~~TRINITY_DN6445_c1_g1_i1.p1  ORF type:complete len:358 (+),score=35.49 TRINITY_DN6445_c1_g1_i1:103-1176(+)